MCVLWCWHDCMYVRWCVCMYAAQSNITCTVRCKCNVRHIDTHVCTLTYVYVIHHMCIHKDMYACTIICIYVYALICMYVCTLMCMYAGMQTELDHLWLHQVFIDTWKAHFFSYTSTWGRVLLSHIKTSTLTALRTRSCMNTYSHSQTLTYADVYVCYVCPHTVIHRIRSWMHTVIYKHLHTLACMHVLIQSYTESDNVYI